MLSSHIPVSATFWINMGATLKKPITIRIPHCAYVETESHAKALSFVKITQSGDVQIIEDGIFPIGESYGELKTDHFCYFTIIQSINKKMISENKYSIIVMKHRQPDSDHWKFHICLIPVLPTFKQVCTVLHSSSSIVTRGQQRSKISYEILKSLKILTFSEI